MGIGIHYLVLLNRNEFGNKLFCTANKGKNFLNNIVKFLKLDFPHTAKDICTFTRKLLISKIVNKILAFIYMCLHPTQPSLSEGEMSLRIKLTELESCL